jgi:hypothetical protein
VIGIPYLPQSDVEKGDDGCFLFTHPHPPLSPRLVQEKNVVHNGNITMKDVIEAARVMRDRSWAKELKGTVKEILGTAFSIGCTVDRQDPRDIQKQIDSGEIDVPKA